MGLGEDIEFSNQTLADDPGGSVEGQETEMWTEHCVHEVPDGNENSVGNRVRGRSSFILEKDMIAFFLYPEDWNKA